jgi:hypothetical protein
VKPDAIDLCEYLGWPERRIPVRWRDPTIRPGMGYCSSLAALYAAVDPRPGGATVDPRSGGIIGWLLFAEALGDVSQRTARRIQQGPYGKSVLMVDGIPATTVTTANNIAYLHELDVSETRRQARLGKRVTDVSGGSGPVNSQTLVETCVGTEQQGSGAPFVPKIWPVPIAPPHPRPSAPLREARPQTERALPVARNDRDLDDALQSQLADDARRLLTTTGPLNLAAIAAGLRLSTREGRVALARALRNTDGTIIGVPREGEGAPLLYDVVRAPS